MTTNLHKSFILRRWNESCCMYQQEEGESNVAFEHHQRTNRMAVQTCGAESAHPTVPHRNAHRLNYRCSAHRTLPLRNCCRSQIAVLNQLLISYYQHTFGYGIGPTIAFIQTPAPDDISISSRMRPLIFHIQLRYHWFATVSTNALHADSSSIMRRQPSGSGTANLPTPLHFRP